MNDSAVAFDVGYTETRSRGTVALRYFMAIPHMIVAGVWGWFVSVITLAQWFIVLFTGKRNESIWNMQAQYLGYQARVVTYINLTHDVFPPFGTEAGAVPVMYQFTYSADANRLSNALRYFWAIPAMLITFVMSIGAFFLVVICWFAIVFTGKMPKGMFDFIVRTLRQSIRTNSYIYLMTDVYPNANPSPTDGYPNPNPNPNPDVYPNPNPGVYPTANP